jgi:hypothetical protein
MAINLPESLQVIETLVERLDNLGISYCVGGSIASSIHGIFRATNDADIVIDLSEGQIEALVEALQDDFYVDGDMIRQGLQDNLSFNVIHLPTMFKVDLFPAKRTPFAESEWSRRRQEEIRTDTDALRIFVASPEDMILQKLLWYRLTGERSDRQWGDVQGMLKVQGDALDFAYLRHWAGEIEVADLLGQALADAGVGGAETPE